MKDFVTRRYVVTVLEMVEEYCAANPDCASDLSSETQLIESILDRLHDTATAEVQ